MFPINARNAAALADLAEANGGKIPVFGLLPSVAAVWFNEDSVRARERALRDFGHSKTRARALAARTASPARADEKTEQEPEAQAPSNEKPVGSKEMLAAIAAFGASDPPGLVASRGSAGFDYR